MADDLATDDKDLDTDDAFNDDDLVDGIEASIDDQTGNGDDPDSEIVDDTDGDEEVPGVTDDDVLDEGDAPKGEPGVDRGDGRDVKGQFTKAEQDAANKAADAAKKAGKSAAEQKAAGDKAASDVKAAAAAKPAADAAAAPKWEPFQVRADKALHPIEGAQVTRHAGNVLIAVPEKQFKAFEHRIGRGIAAERQGRELAQMRRELDFDRAAPKPRSDAEIEAAMLVETLNALKDTDGVTPLLNTIFTEEQLENLKLKVKLAQREEKDTFATKEAERRSTANDGEAWQRTQVDTLVDQAFELVEQHPELQGMTEDQIKETLEELAMPLRDKLVWKENGEVFANTDVLFKLLKRAKVSAGSAAAPANAGQPAAPAPGAKPKPTADGERFNKAQDSAAQPRTTSLKDGRKAPAPAPRRPTRETVPPNRQRTNAQRAEDDHRKTVRSLLSSDSFD